MSNLVTNKYTYMALLAWLAICLQVLRFYGYFKEAVVESAVENHRVRKVVVQYYVTDGTIQVIEPKEDNSGIPQGTFLKRHRVEKAEGGGYVNATDLVVGSEVELYGRTYYLTDADDFTRDFLQKEFGIELNEPESKQSQYSSASIIAVFIRLKHTRRLLHIPC